MKIKIMSAHKTHKGWTNKEDNILRQSHQLRCVPDGKLKIMALLPHRSWVAIRLRSSRHLGFKVKALDWTKKEDGVLRRHYARLPKEQLLTKLPDRTWVA